MVATICDSGMNGNLFAAVNLQNDENVIQIDKWANASELYFFKMLMRRIRKLASVRNLSQLTGVLTVRSNQLLKDKENGRWQRKKKLR